MSISSFPPPKRTLMGPGPSDVPQRILDALGRPTLGHLDPLFIGMMDELKSPAEIRLQDGKRTDSAYLGAGVSGDGSLLR